MTRLFALALIAVVSQGAMAEDAKPTTITINGSEWVCTTIPGHGDVWHTCYAMGGPDLGGTYNSGLPLTAQSLKSYQDQQTHDGEEAACECSLRVEEGGQSHGIFCTGAFAPTVLRKRTVDPCAGAWVQASIACPTGYFSTSSGCVNYAIAQQALDQAIGPPGMYKSQCTSIDDMEHWRDCWIAPSPPASFPSISTIPPIGPERMAPDACFVNGYCPSRDDD